MKNNAELIGLRAAPADRIAQTAAPRAARPMRVLIGYGVLALLGVAAVPAVLAFGAEAAVVLGFAAFFPLCLVIGRATPEQAQVPFKQDEGAEEATVITGAELEILYGADYGYGYRS